MKKTILVLAITLIVAAILSFVLCIWYDHLGGSVMDAAGDFYSNAYRKYLLFRNWGIGLIIPGGILLIIYMFVLKKR